MRINNIDNRILKPFIAGQLITLGTGLISIGVYNKMINKDVFIKGDKNESK